MTKKDYDAIVVGSGPNGLAAAITLQREGLSVLLLEGKASIGGGLRSEQLTLPGFIHDVCSAIHPLAASSPFLKTLPLEKYGLQFINPPVAAAHPFEDGTAAALLQDVNETAQSLGIDSLTYLKLIKPLVNDWSGMANDLLGPFHFPKMPLAMAGFGLKSFTSASWLSRRFKTVKARGLWAGMAAHAAQPLSNPVTSAIPLVLMATGHLNGWPLAKGGSVSIANAMASCFTALGGKIETNYYVRSLHKLPSAHAILFDVTPKQLLEIAGYKFSAIYKWQLQRYRYGCGVFKIDWALNEPIPFSNLTCMNSATVHLGNTFEEIATAELLTAKGKHPERPFVLLAQQSLFDASRAPLGKQTAWAYCHVPNGSTVDMTKQIEDQVERFAPGFKNIIIERHVMNTEQIQQYNENYVGGDISGGLMSINQLFTRPALRSSPYKTSAKGLYICSSSTPPGGGVHGMCGYNAAKKVLKDLFHIKPQTINFL